MRHCCQEHLNLNNPRGCYREPADPIKQKHDAEYEARSRANEERIYRARIKEGRIGPLVVS